MFSEKIKIAAKNAEDALFEAFKNTDEICEENTQKVLSAFWANNISETMLHGTTGYGYDDRGRDCLDKVFADVFGAEDALVRHQFVSGTHVLSTAMFAVLRPGDTMLSVTGLPYDTLHEAIGINNKNGEGSLADFGIKYRQVDLKSDGKPDLPAICEVLKNDKTVKLVFIQRSRGYTQRPTLPLTYISSICREIKQISNAVILVDNCYGEFVCTQEPIEAGADLIAGSLIKNPGGGLAQTGGYIAGKADLIQKAACRLTSAGIGKECGATHSQQRLMYQGFFMAPHITAQAKKTSLFAAKLFEDFGYEVFPKPLENREDIIQTINFGNEAALTAFCRGIQSGAPIDSYVTPEAWEMPGYADKVIMAAGAFVSGASIELSADAPIKPPYTAYFQGGLTYHSGKIAIMKALSELIGE